MALSLPNPLMDNSGEIRRLERELREAEGRIADLEADLVRERAKVKAVERGAAKLRQFLTPLHQGLGMVFGEFEAMGVEDAPVAPQPAAVQSSAKDAAWEDWKKKLGGKAAEAIDILKLHGALNTKQLRLHLHCESSYAYQVVSKLHTHGLINKNGGKISLKEL